MDYPPNVGAAVRFATRILPRIAADMRGARFHVVGRAPTAAVRALDGRDGCTVHGEVADVRPWLAAADLVIAPLIIARGIQNKVLEAMAMARPVLVSPQAATGIAGRDGIHFAVADSDDEFATRAIALLRSPEERTRMGQAARDFVIAHHGWTEALAQLPRLVGIPSSEAHDAA
jgi:glycosyltransferase involved in cell wall biosynthesis